MRRLSEYGILAVWLLLTASSFVVAEQLMPYANPIASTSIRFLLATLLLSVWVRGRYLRGVSLALVLRYFGVSALLVAFFLGLFVALETTSAVKTSVIYTLLPLMTVILSYLLLGQTSSLLQCLGFLLGTLGALWLLLDLNSLNRETLSDWRWVRGDAVFLGACACLALHVVLLKRWFTAQMPTQSVFFILVFGSLMLLPVFIAWGDIETIQWREFGFWWPVLYLAGFATLGTFLLQQRLLQRLSANHLLAVSYLSPTVVVLLTMFSWLQQGSSGSWGIALTLVGMGLIFRSYRMDEGGDADMHSHPVVSQQGGRGAYSTANE